MDAIDPGDIPPSFRPFAEAILRQDRPTAALVELLGTVGQKAPAAEAADFALLLRRHLEPGARLGRVTDLFIRDEYPLWYIRAVTDRHRNRAYRNALEALVTPATVVVEAGTGSGLFAMLAARAGAHHVYTCESNTHVAAIARGNIDRNGLADRITLFECSYQDLTVGDQLPRRGDLLLHEFVSAEFNGDKLMTTLKNLRANVLTPEAAILPQGFRSIGMLVGDTWMLDEVRVSGPIEGFDVAAINLLAGASISLPGPVAIETPLSGPHTLASCDAMSKATGAATVREVGLRATADGRCTGLLQWIAHDFPDGSSYENRPDIACNWSPVFWPFGGAVTVRTGETVLLRVENNRTEIFIDLAGDKK